MDYSCENCRFCYIKYKWDELCEDEVEILSCQKGHTIPCDHVPCLDFKKYRRSSY